MIADPGAVALPVPGVGPVTVDGDKASVEVVDAEAALEAVADVIAARVAEQLAEKLAAGSAPLILARHGAEALAEAYTGHWYCAPQAFGNHHTIQLRYEPRPTSGELAVWIDLDGRPMWSAVLRAS